MESSMYFGANRCIATFYKRNSKKSIILTKKAELLFTFSFLSTIIGIFGVPDQTTYAQLLNDKDNDSIEDNLDPCPDDPDIQCEAPENEAVLPGVNAPLDADAGQVQEIAGGELPQQPDEVDQKVSLNEICDNTIDDDGDNLVDSDDPDCLSPAEGANSGGEVATGEQQNKEATNSDILGLLMISLLTYVFLKNKYRQEEHLQ